MSETYIKDGNFLEKNETDVVEDDNKDGNFLEKNETDVVEDDNKDVVFLFYKEYPKNITESISPHLTLREFRCKCRSMKCTITITYATTIRSFEYTREDFKKPIVVNSAFRCKSHNKKVGGIETSRHLLGKAMDLRPRDIEDLDSLEKIARKYFQVVIRYETFIHCHNEE